VQEITEITTGLKALAKELSVPRDRALAALASGGIARRQASAALGSARIGLDRAGRRRGDVRLSRRVLSEGQGAEGRHRGLLQVASRDGTGRTAPPKSSSASSVTARPAPSSYSSRPRSPASPTSPTKTNSLIGLAIDQAYAENHRPMLGRRHPRERPIAGGVLHIDLDALARCELAHAARPCRRRRDRRRGQGECLWHRHREGRAGARRMPAAARSSWRT
jgi:hypothetical protein